MDLSNDLISKFVKITNDGDKKKTKEGTVYGTAVKYDGSIYVKIDGSDLLTPIDTTADIKEGERVTIMIKDHNATVTGNVTSPSASSADVKKVTKNVEEIEGEITEFEAIIADVVHVGELDAEVARIDELIAGKATIEDLTATNAEITNLKAKDAEIENLVADKATIEDLTATNAEITNLKAKDAEIENLVADKATIEDLTATNAEITNLKADKADITYLDANFATIDELEATHANIEVLDAEVASINTLVNGNLTSDNILSFNITSKNTTMEDAFIKDAMIDRITANKIMSGTIDTNNVVIQSTDGSMLLQGNIIQMKDESGKVRIQIGKDNGGNFTFVLYDETGKGVLIDEEGIKSSDAIADGLIVDAKVADNANISGSKLDIASVITEVNNDNSTTIKSSKIYLNEQNQSLEVAFNSLKSQVETIQDVTIDGDLSRIVEQVQSNTTKIEANKEGINTLVAENVIRTEEINDLEEDIQTVNTSLSNKYASLEQSLEGFKTTVSNTYTSKTEFNNLQVGGRNLFIGSKDYAAGTWLNKSLWGSNGTTSDGLIILSKSAPWGGLYQSFTMKPNEVYTMSAYIKGDGKATVNCYGNGSILKRSFSQGETASTTWRRYWFTCENTSSSDVSWTGRFENGIDNATLQIYGIKCEKGNKATDWSPAPEDVQANIDAVDGKFANYSTTTQMNSAINQKANEITSSVSSTYTTKTEFNNLEVGGRNYALSSNTEKSAPDYTYVIYDISTKAQTELQGKEVTISFEAKKTSGTANMYAYLRDPSIGYISPTSDSIGDITTSYKRYSVTFTAPSDLSRASQIGIHSTGVVGLYVRNVKLEKGNKPTDWTPAPEDVQANIDAVDGKFANYSTTTQMNSAIQQKANEITSSVSSTYTTKTEFQNLAIGGRNLIRQSVVSANAVASSSYDKNTATWTLTANAGAGGTWGAGLVLSGNSIRIPYGKTYVLSFEIKVPRACSWNIDVNNYAVTGSSWNGNDNDNGSVRATSSKSLVANQWIKCWSRISNTASGNTDKVDIYDNSNFGVVMQNETSSMTYQIRNIQGEIGNIPSEYTPAPEDVQSQIDTINTNLSTSYATKSELTQTNNSIVAKFSESGGYNMLMNGHANNGYSFWENNGGGINTDGVGIYASNDLSGGYFVTKQPSGIRYSGGVRLDANTHYVYQAKVLMKATYSGNTATPLHYWTSTSEGFGTIDKNLITIDDYNQNIPKVDTWYQLYMHFHTGATACYFKPFIYTNSGSATICVSEIMLSKSKTVQPWSPHPSEIYDGITKIDKNGLQVSQSNYNGYTQMKADGFYVNNGSENVISITKDGSYFKGKVVITSGSTVPTSVLSGTILSTQLDSGITSDISTAKSNASTAVSTANTASTNASNAVKTANTASTNASNAVSTANTASTNASNAVSTANTASTNASNAVKTANTASTNASTAVSTANTAKSTADSVKSTVDSGKTNWTNAYNRVNEWAYGAVTGSTTIDGGYIQTNTILANKLAIGDFNNYCDLRYGFSSGVSWAPLNWNSNGYWNNDTTKQYIQLNQENTTHAFNNNDSINFTFDFWIDKSITLYMGLWYYDSSMTYLGVNYTSQTVSTLSTWHTISKNVTVSGMPTGTKYVRVMLNLNTTGCSVAIKNIKVFRRSGGELIVDGAITAAKIASRTITADRIVSGAITANEIAANAITAAKISSGAITADKLAANAITSKTITGSTITGGTISGATITSETLMKTYGGMYVGSEIWGGFKKDSNGNYSSAQTFTIRGSAALQIDGNPTRISSVTGEVKIGDASSYDNLRAREIYAQEIIYTNDLRTRDAAQLSLSNVSMRSANAFIEFSSGYGVIRVKNRNHLYLQTSSNTGGDTSAEIRCTRYSDTSNYVNIRAYNVCAQNAVYANGVNVSSDINRKRDIELYSTDALQEVCSTPVYAYHLDTDKDEELKRIGIIMQEAPLDAIDLTGKGVDLYQMVTMLWRAVQQQQEIINELKGE